MQAVVSPRRFPRPLVVVALVGCLAVCFGLLAGALMAANPVDLGGEGGGTSFDQNGANSGTVTGVQGTASGECPGCAPPKNVPVTYNPTSKVITLTIPNGTTAQSVAESPVGDHYDPDPPHEAHKAPGDTVTDTELDQAGDTVTISTSVGEQRSLDLVAGMMAGEPGSPNVEEFRSSVSYTVVFDIDCPGAPAVGKCTYSVTVTIQLDHTGTATGAQAGSP